MGESIADIVIWCLKKLCGIFDDDTIITTLKVNLRISDLRGFVSGTGPATSVYGGVQAVWDLTVGFAMGLIMVYFMWEMNSKWAFEGNDLNMKSLAGPFCKVIFAIILFNNSGKIATGMINFYNACIDKGAAAGAIDIPDTKNLREQLESLGIMSAVVILLPMLAVVLICYVLKFSFIYKALMIKFEFLFRVGFTPLAMADSFNGLNSNSMRWIKGFVGYGVYTAAFVLIPSIGIDIMKTYMADIGTITGEGLNFVFQVLEKIVMVVAVPFAELGVIGAIKQLSKEAAG